MTDTGGSAGFGWQFFSDARTFLDVAGGRIGDDPLGSGRSDRLCESLGYRAVCDTAELTLR